MSLHRIQTALGRSLAKMCAAVPYRIDRRCMHLPLSHSKPASCNKLELVVPRFFSTEADKPDAASLDEEKGPEEDPNEVSHCITQIVAESNYLTVYCRLIPDVMMSTNSLTERCCRDSTKRTQMLPAMLLEV